MSEGTNTQQTAQQDGAALDVNEVEVNMNQDLSVDTIEA